jgi:hypothetical protein
MAWGCDSGCAVLGLRVHGLGSGCVYQSHECHNVKDESQQGHIVVTQS